MLSRRKLSGLILLFAIAVGHTLFLKASAQPPITPVLPTQPAVPTTQQSSPPLMPSVPRPASPPTAVQNIDIFTFGMQQTRGGPGQMIQAMPGTKRFAFTIDEKAPIQELLPTPPSKRASVGPLLSDDLTGVPEVEFQARTTQKMTLRQEEEIAYQIARINHVNEKKADAFMTALLANRDDLGGMPFAMGNACRSVGERSKQFTSAVNTVRLALSMPVTTVQATTPTAPPPTVMAPQAPETAPNLQELNIIEPAPGTPPEQSFWPQFRKLCEQQDAQQTDKNVCEHMKQARIAALMQILAPESVELRLGLVKYLAGVAHVDATRALARLAVFSPEENVRVAAIESLKVRREKDYTDILLYGLQYPWPAVAKNSAEAIVRMERSDLIPELVKVLDRQDPRLPETKKVGGQETATIREMVKVNHHRNCLMCHQPGNSGTVSADALTAQIPVPGEPLNPPSQGYGQSQSPDMMVRIDVTYLRQDFSVRQSVPDANPWPEMQRFDFLVRERKLTSEEAAEFRTKLTPAEAGVFSPYHRSALAALRELTGKDTAPTAEAWRKLLALPKPEPVKAEVRD